MESPLLCCVGEANNILKVDAAICERGLSVRDCGVEVCVANGFLECEILHRCAVKANYS